MKKMISTLLFVILVASAVLPAAAQLDMTISSVYDSVTDSIKVSGTVASDKGSIPLALEITDPDGEFAAAEQTIATKDANGNVRYSFAPVLLPQRAPGGDYTITVSGHFVDNVKVSVLAIPGADEQLTLMQALADSTAPYSVILANAATFGANETKLNNLDAKGQKALNAIMTDKTYELPEGIESDEDAKKTKEAFKAACKDIIAALKIAEFADIAKQEELISWISEYYEEFGFHTDSDATAESEEALTTFVELVQDEAEFLSRLTKKEDLLTESDIQAALYEAAVLTTISTQNDYQVMRAVKSFTTFFPIGSMSEAKLSEKCEKIKGNSYDSYDEVTEALKKSSSSSGSSDDGGSGNWGGRGKDNIYIPSVTAPVEPSATTGFTDLAQASWAKDAINDLATKGIISGRGNGIFAPSDRVTRAEFIKILITATDTAVDGSLPSFSDVPADAWYAPYIAAAEKAGLAKGTEDGCFMPEAEITRQDVAVLLYRAFNLSAEETESAFNDNGEISEYAKAAVSVLVSKGIINGVGDNNFAPLASATRAQAAQMIYNALKLQ